MDLDSAIISECGRYRYALTRRWGPDPQAIWIMLNPSTADATMNDPTIRRCMTFSKSFGYGALTVVNLYAWRATNPAELKMSGRDVVGPENDSILRSLASTGWPVIAAWGTRADPGRARHVIQLVGAHLLCLGTTKDGHPKHPLYVRGDTSLIPFRESR